MKAENAKFSNTQKFRTALQAVGNFRVLKGLNTYKALKTQAFRQKKGHSQRVPF